jgi:hypothetical protein
MNSFCDSHSWVGWFLVLDRGSIKESTLSNKRAQRLEIIGLHFFEELTQPDCLVTCCECCLYTELSIWNWR